MNSLKDTFNSPDSRVSRTVMFVEMTDATAMKENQSQATWLTTLGWFYDRINKLELESVGTIVKYISDGAMVVFDTDHVADAINAAISLQEELTKARHDDVVYCFASIGIATGIIVKFEHLHGQEDYVGSAVDLALELCSAASPQAILVDSQTVNHANMGKVKSQIGRLCSPPRAAQDYLGEVHKFKAKGFKNEIRYHQIFWGNHHYGLKPEFVEILTTENTRSVSINDLLQMASQLWNNGQRQEALDLCIKLSESADGVADAHIFEMAKITFLEAYQTNNRQQLQSAWLLLEYLAGAGHQEAATIINQWRRQVGR